MNSLVIACSQQKRDPLTLPYHSRDDVDGTPIAPAWAVYDGAQCGSSEVRAIPRHGHPDRLGQVRPHMLAQ
jgi:hypothetical protein